MDYLKNIIKGVVIGITMMVPGVSGGTMAIVLGIYDRLVRSVASIFRDLKNNLLFLAQVGIGGAAGVLIFSRLMEGAMTRYPHIMRYLIMGIIIGGLPLLYKKASAAKEARSQGSKAGSKEGRVGTQGSEADTVDIPESEAGSLKIRVGTQGSEADTVGIPESDAGSLKIRDDIQGIKANTQLNETDVSKSKANTHPSKTDIPGSKANTRGSGGSVSVNKTGAWKKRTAIQKAANGASDYLFLILGAVIVLLMSLEPESMVNMATDGSLTSYIFLLVSGFIIAVGVVLPGISWAFMLLVLGMYEITLNAINTFNIPFLIPLGIGMVLGIFGTSKIIEKFLQKYPRKTYMLIIGFVVGSLAEVHPGIPQGWQLPASAVAFIAGFAVIFVLGRKGFAE